MKKLILRSVLLFAVVAPQPAISETETLLNETVPKQYRVVEGDTLWDISDLFLRDPWMWPEIWHANQQIANSHLRALKQVIPWPFIGLANGSKTLSPKIKSDFQMSALDY